jgi:predicted nucleotide-binding protein
MSRKETLKNNVLFEMDLFMGRLSKERIYFVKSKESKDVHLPSDLLGINHGLYDSTQEEGNLTAASGHFAIR